MTNFIAVESIRDYDLSPAQMTELSRIIEVENYLRGIPHNQYAVFENGVVTKCIMLVDAGLVCSAVYFHNASLEEIEAVVRKHHSGARYINAYAQTVKNLGQGWQITGANFKTRITTVTRNYRFEDTQHPMVKICHTDLGSVIATVLDDVISVVMSSEHCTTEVQRSIDALAGVAVSENKIFTVQAQTPVWQSAFLTNPNYVFNNSTLTKDLLA